jgi:pilus assembly protein CpaF
VSELAEWTGDFDLSEPYQLLKGRLYLCMMRLVDEEKIPLGEWSLERIRSFVEGRVEEQIEHEGLSMSRREIAALCEDMLSELVGYGPIQRLIDDAQVAEVFVNGHTNVFAKRAGRFGREKIRFVDEAHVLRIMQRIVAPLGRRLDQASPIIDARLPDGSQVNAILPPPAI